MKWQLDPDATNRRLEVQVTGPIKAEPLQEMTRELRDALLANGYKEVLLDYTQAVSQLEPYQIYERPRILQNLAFPVDVKVAVLYSALDQDTQFLENVYRNKGFPVKVFSSRTSALSWLTSTGAEQ